MVGGAGSQWVQVDEFAPLNVAAPESLPDTAIAPGIESVPTCAYFDHASFEGECRQQATVVVRLAHVDDSSCAAVPILMCPGHLHAVVTACRSIVAAGAQHRSRHAHCERCRRCIRILSDIVVAVVRL